MPFRVGCVYDPIPNQTVGLILPLELLILHHAALLIKLCLINGTQKVAHAV